MLNWISLEAFEILALIEIIHLWSRDIVWVSASRHSVFEITVLARIGIGEVVAAIVVQTGLHAVRYGLNTRVISHIVAGIIHSVVIGTRLCLTQYEYLNAKQIYCYKIVDLILLHLLINFFLLWKKYFCPVEKYMIYSAKRFCWNITFSAGFWAWCEPRIVSRWKWRSFQVTIEWNLIKDKVVAVTLSSTNGLAVISRVHSCVVTKCILGHINVFPVTRCWDDRYDM